MWLRCFLGINVQDRMAMGDQPVGNQHTMTAEVNALSAHVGDASISGGSEQFGDAMLEFRGQHVVGVVTETRATHAGVR